MKHPLLNGPFGLGSSVRYEFGGGAKMGLENITRIPKKTLAEAKRAFSPKIPKVIPPELPPPIATTRQISEESQRAGQMERRRRRRGKLRTIFAGKRDLAPAITSKAGLKTTFG